MLPSVSGSTHFTRWYSPERLFQPVDGSSLALFRLLTGLVALGWLLLDLPRLSPELIRATLRFSHEGLSWLPLLPGPAMYALYGVLGLFSIALALGLYYRVAAPLLTLGFAYVFLLEQSRYTDAGYFLLLALLLLSLLPAHHAASVDARRQNLAATVPLWAPLSAAVLTALPLLYMGILRMAPDWLGGYPFWIEWKTAATQSHSLVPGAVTLTVTQTAPQIWSLFGVLVHLLLVPMLLWRPTRVLGLGLWVLYYAGLSLALGRVEFPFAMAAGLVLFFPPDAPRTALGRMFGTLTADTAFVATPIKADRLTPAFAAILLLLLIHALIPARSLLYPGPAGWSGEGERFAWRAGLDDKACLGYFVVHDPATTMYQKLEGRELDSLLTAPQRQTLFGQPSMLAQFGRAYARQWAQLRKQDRTVMVYPRIQCSYNSRPYWPFVNPRQDLATATLGLGATEWVGTLDRKFPPGWRVVGPGK